MKITLAVLFLSAMASAQQDMGVITGLVTDSTGASIPGAKVTAINQDTNEVRAVESSMEGAYTIGPLRIGNYRIEAEKEGFKKTLWQNIKVSAQDRIRADVRMELGQIAESISVTAEAALLQAETSNIAHVVEEREIRNLPINGRNFQQLAWLTAGVSPSTRGRDRESGFNAHGQPVTQNNFIIDGIDNNNNIMGMQDRKAQVVVPSLDAVAEFKVQTANYSAEFGRNSGAVMIVNLKSGTNQFHGTAYEYIRNDVFDSRDAFAYGDRTGDGKADPEVLRQHQFGTTFGGPIRRDKTFFFGSWEGFRQRRAQTDLVIVPTAEERNGLFPTRLALITDPATRQPFPGNQIPQSRFDPTAAKLISLYPQPNFGGSGTRQNFLTNPPWSLTRDQVDGRVDHNLSDNDKIFGRFSLNRFDNLRGSVFEPPARGGQNNDRALDDNDARSAVFSWTRILSSSLVNEFRYGLIRQKVDKRELSAEPQRQLLEQFGLRGIPAYDRLFGLPQFTLGGGIGYANLGEPGSMPNFKIHQVHQYLNNLSWNRGKHNLKFGVDLRWNRSDIFGGDAAHGNFTFDGQFTRISMADFLMGTPSSFALSTLLGGQMRFRNYMAYAQDDWKLTRKLTVNLGIRYELTTPWWDKQNNMNKLELAPGANYGAIVTAGSCGDSYSCRGLVNTDTNNWAPRLGFAYQLSPRTVIRTGAGVFYAGQGSLGGNGRMIANFPFSRRATLQSTVARPALQLSTGVPVNVLGDGRTPPANANWQVWEENFPAPGVYQWNFAIQREAFRDTTVTVAYVGSSSNYIMESYNWNGSDLGPLATEVQRRRFPQWNTISLTTPLGSGNYHGLDVQLDKKYANGFALTGAYTWGHSIDNISEQFGAGGGGLTYFRNFSLSRGHSNYDTRHRFVASGVYELPYANRRGVAGAILGGWQLSSLFSVQTGHYFTITVPNSRQRLGATGVGNWWPDRIRDPRLETRTAQRWFDTSAFALPRAADGSWYLGNAGRSILNGDGPFNWDAGLMKNFRLNERMGLQVRWEVFNVTNSPTLADPDTNIESPDFGKVRATVSTPRQMQFAIRLSF
ncbi:MAG: TonB-dependent receptor [Bryobacteraceae bacterium]|nr:TonB-dependent receptor [Bryobacteraceae bacterium]